MGANKPTTPLPDVSPATYSEVEDEQLRAMLAATPAQRLDMAEQLLELYLAAQQKEK